MKFLIYLLGIFLSLILSLIYVPISFFIVCIYGSYKDWSEFDHKDWMMPYYLVEVTHNFLKCKDIKDVHNLKERKIWHTAQIIKLSLQCVRSAQPIRWEEVRSELRGSKWFRRTWIKECLNNSLFRLHSALSGIKL